MLPKDSYAWRGYVHNRKGFSISRNGSGEDIAYILNIEDTPTGKRLKVETWYKKGSVFVEGLTWNPIIPYRVMFNDHSVIWALNQKPELWQQQASGSDLIFNPGVSLNAEGKLDAPVNVGPNSTVRFIELNLTRDQIPQYVYDRFIWQKPATTIRGAPNADLRRTYWDRGLDCKVHDAQAGFIVRNQDANTDVLYIWVTTVVTMHGTMYRVLNSSSTKQLGVKETRYSLPVLLKIEVDRPSLKIATTNPNFTPVAWKYALPLAKFTSSSTDDIMALSVINAGLGSSFLTHSWNMNLISGNDGIIDETDSYYDYIPAPRGTILDACWDSVNSDVVVCGAHGYYNRIKQKWLQAFYVCTYNSFASSFSAEDTNPRWREMLVDYMSIRRVSCAQNGNYILMTANDYGIQNPDAAREDQINSVQWIELYILTGGSAAYVTKQIVNGEIEMGYVHPYGTTWAFMVLHENSKVKVYQTSSAATMASTFAGTNFGLNLDGLVDHRGFTFLKEYVYRTERVLQTYKTLKLWGGVNQIFFANAGGDVYWWGKIGLPKIFIDETGEDKTMSRRMGPGGGPGYHELFWKSYHLNVLHNRIIQIVNMTAGSCTILTYQSDYSSTALDTITDGITSYQDYGVGSSDYYKMQIDTVSTVDRLGKIQEIVPYIQGEFTISESGNIGYWSNPTFESIDGKGVRVVLWINNCSGVFRSGNWTRIANGQAGVNVDWTQTRKDLSFVFGGDYDSYASINGSGYYWAVLSDPSWEISMNHQGTELIPSKNGEALLFANYDTNGIFQTHVDCYLDMSSYGDQYSVPDFSLSDVAWKLVIHTQDPIVATGLLDIAPPSPSGTITTSGIYKAAFATNYYMSSNTSTALENVRLLKNGQLYKTLGTLNYPVSRTYPLDFSDAVAGTNYRFNYVPSLFSSKKLPEQTSEILTYVRGHKYSLSDVTISIDGSDKTDEIRDSEKGYVYVSPGASSATIDVTYSISHANWTEAYPSNLERTYPVISGAYLMITPLLYLPPIWQGGIAEEPPPVGSSATYPNCSYYFVDQLLNIWDNVAAARRDYQAYGGTTIDLTGETLSVDIEQNGKWHIYLIVEDEFLQGSAWNITNIRDNYNITFGRLHYG